MVLRARRRTAGGTASYPWLGDLGFGVSGAIIAVALLASFQAMKQLKFFARLGGAVEVILRETMKPQWATSRCLEKRTRSAKRKNAIKASICSRRRHGSEFYFDLGLKP